MNLLFRNIWYIGIEFLYKKLEQREVNDLDIYTPHTPPEILFY